MRRTSQSRLPSLRARICASAALCVCVVVGGALAPAASAATRGAPLTLSANTGEGCEALVAPSLRSVLGVPQSCIFFGSDAAGAWTSQAPTGSWVITRASVRAGPRVGPMAFVVLQAMRSQATPTNPPAAPGTPVVGGLICCSVAAESAVFTPAPNAVTEVPVNLPAVNTVEELEGEPVEVVDYLGIAVLSLESSLPIHLAAGSEPGASAVSSYLIPRAASGVRVGEEILIEGALPGWTPLVAGDFQAPPAVAPQVPVVPVPPATPPSTAPPGATPPSNAFKIVPGIKLLHRGTRARLGVELPGPGALTIGSPARAAGHRGATASRKHRQTKAERRSKRLLAPLKRHIAHAGKVKVTLRLTRRGRARLARRHRLRIPVTLTFTPTGGSPASHRRTLTFRSPHRR